MSRPTETEYARIEEAHKLLDQIAALQAALSRVEAERDAAVACIHEAEEAVRFQRLSAVGLAIFKWRGAQGGWSEQ